MRATGGMPSACFWIFGKGIGDGLDFFVDEIRDSGSISQYIFINSPTTCRNFDLQRQHMSFLAHSYVYIRYPIAGNIEHPSFFFTSKSGDFFVWINNKALDVTAFIYLFLFACFLFFSVVFGFWMHFLSRGCLVWMGGVNYYFLTFWGVREDIYYVLILNCIWIHALEEFLKWRIGQF